MRAYASEANAFINSDKFDEAINTARFILSNLDKDSTAAQSIIERAKKELEAMAKEKAEALKGDLKNKLDNL